VVSQFVEEVAKNIRISKALREGRIFILIWGVPDARWCEFEFDVRAIKKATLNKRRLFLVSVSRFG